MLTFNVSSYGATFGSGQVEAVQRANLTAVRDAIDAANAASSGDDVEVVIDDTDVLECFFDSATDELAKDAGGNITCLGIIKPTANTFTFRGLGASSEVSFFPDAPTFTYNMLYIDAFLGSRTVTISNVTLNGPPTFGAEDPVNDYDRYVIKHQGASATGYARAVVTVSGVVTTGVPTGAFNSNSGEVDVVFTGANDMTGLMICCSVFNQSLHAKTLVVESGSYASTYSATDEGVCWYIHPNVAAPAGNVMFEPGVVLACATRYCIYFNGNPNTPVPPRVIIDGVSYTGGDFVQSNSVCTTEIRNCSGTVQADEGAFCISLWDTEIHHNTITGGAIQTAPGPHGLGVGRYQHVHDNDYLDLAPTIPPGTHNFCAFPNGLIENNTAVGVSVPFSFLGGLAPTADGQEVIAEGNTITGTFGRGFASVGDELGRIVLRGNTIGGTSPFVYGIGGSGTSLDLVLENNVTNDNAILLLDFGEDLVSGSGNTLRDSFPIDFSVGAASNQLLQNGPATNPTPVASATTINLSPNYSRANLTGTTPVETLYIADDVDQTNAFAGRITFTFDSACVISDAGNINPIITTAREIGTSATFTWSRSLQSWNETSPDYIDPRILYSDARIGHAATLPEFYDVLIAKLNEIQALIGGASSIDPNVLLPSADAGEAMPVEEFYSLVILTINELIDTGLTVDQIDPRVLYPDSDSGRAIAVSPFTDLVIATVNLIIDEL